jgi:CRP-like cAMP-binding protein
MTIEDDIAFLQRVPTLSLLGRDALRIIAIGAESHQLQPGDVLFAAGDPADAGYVVREGSFSLERMKASADAHEMISRAGALLGELALITHTVRPVTAIALETSTVLRITRNLFLKTLESSPAAAKRLRADLAARAGEAVKDISGMHGMLRRDNRTPGDG